MREIFVVSLAYKSLLIWIENQEVCNVVSLFVSTYMRGTRYEGKG